MTTRRILAALALALTSTTCAAAGQETILFDFGSPRHATDGLVNNVTSPGRLGLLVENAEDTRGELTTVSIRQLDGWCGINLSGHQGDTPYPAESMRDSFYVGGAADRSAKIRIEGLMPGRPYTFTFFASRMESARRRAARYRIAGRAVELDASNNTETCVSIADARADSEGTVSVEIECAEADGFAYLGVLAIRGEFPEGRLVRQPPDRLDGPPPVSAKAWAIADGNTGQLLWGFNEDQPRKIASTTKIMCAWVVVQMAAADPKVLDEVVTFSKLADQTGGSTSGVREGESLTVGELLYGLMLPSGNDAGNALAEHFNGRFDPPESPELKDNPELKTRARFVAEMNRSARRLGMTGTTYRIPYGDGGNASQFTSTARDLLKLARTAMQNPLFHKYVNTPRYRCTVEGPEGDQRIVVWKNTNQLLQIEGYDGVKTGTTDQAGACLVSSGRRGSDHLLVVVLGSEASPCRYIDTRNLFRWAWLQRGHKPQAEAAGDGQSPPAQPVAADQGRPLADAARLVVQAIVEAAEQNRPGPAGGVGVAGAAAPLSGDRLTEHLVRRAAAAAKSLPPEVAAKAYLLGLGIGLDDSDVLREVPMVGRLSRQAESEEERTRRLAVLGKPTMRGRRDLAQHFVVSSALAAVLTPEAAEAAGLVKEISDSQGSSGFSFADLAADLAGVTFATHLADSRLTLADLAESFAVRDFLPDPGQWPEGISWEVFQSRYGSVRDERFLRQQAEIRRRILALPGYTAR